MIQSVRNYWREYFVYPIMFIMFGFLAYAVVANESPSRYWDLRLLSFDSLFISLSTIGFVLMMHFDNITIVDGSLIAYSIFGTKKIEIDLSCISSWIEVARKGKGGEITKYFTIHFNGRKYKFKSSYYKNYDQIAAHIKCFGAHDIDLENKIENKYFGKGGSIMVSLGIITLVASSALYFSATRIVSIDQIATVAGVVGNIPKIDVGSKGSKSIVIFLRNYPDFVFQISGSTYKAMDARKYVNQVQYGDSIFIEIDKGVYERKIAGKEPMSFWDKHWDYKHLQPLEIYTRNTSYLALYDYNKENNENIVGVIICGIMGLFCMLIGIAMVQNKREAKIM